MPDSGKSVITSYSIHYTKLYDGMEKSRPSADRDTSTSVGRDFSIPVTVPNDISPREEGGRRKEFTAAFEGVNASYNFV